MSSNGCCVAGSSFVFNHSMMTEVGNRSSQLTATSPPTMWSPKWSTPWLPLGVLKYNSDSDSHPSVDPWSEKSQPLPVASPDPEPPGHELFPAQHSCPCLPLPCAALLSPLPQPNHLLSLGRSPASIPGRGTAGQGTAGRGWNPGKLHGGGGGAHTQKVRRNLSLRDWGLGSRRCAASVGLQRVQHSLRGSGGK